MIRDMADEIEKPEPVVKVDNVKNAPDADSGVHVTENPIMALPPVNPGAEGSLSSDMSPVMREMQGIEGVQPVNEEVFEEIPVEVCGQLYKTALEVGFSLKNKGMPMRELPTTRVETQAQIIYGIMKKNQINIKHIDLFMLGAGMMGDWKYMNSFSNEQKQEDANAGSFVENNENDYGEIKK